MHPYTLPIDPARPPHAPPRWRRFRCAAPPAGRSASPHSGQGANPRVRGPRKVPSPQPSPNPRVRGAWWPPPVPGSRTRVRRDKSFICQGLRPRFRHRGACPSQGCVCPPQDACPPASRSRDRWDPPPGGTPPRVKATGKIWVVPAVGKEGRIPPRVCVCVCPTRVPRDPCGISPEDRPEWGVRGLRLQGPTTRPSLAGIQGGSHSGDEAGPPRVPPHGGPGPGCYRRVQSKSGFCRCLRSPAGRLPSCARPWGQKKVAGEQEDLQLPPHHPRGAIATLPGSGRWDGAGA